MTINTDVVHAEPEDSSATDGDWSKMLNRARYVIDQGGSDRTRTGNHAERATAYALISIAESLERISSR